MSTRSTTTAAAALAVGLAFLLTAPIAWADKPEKPKKGGGAYFYTKPDEHGDVAWGGEDVITLDQENPEIHKEYEAELAKNGVQCNMGHVSKYCTFK